MFVGEKVGRHGIRNKIGSGGMGEVYLAENTELDRIGALKFLHPVVASDEVSQILFYFGSLSRVAAARNIEMAIPFK